jgi:hypothetical protein
MTKDPKNVLPNNSALAGFHQQFNTLPKDLKIMIVLSGLNGTTASIVESYMTATTIAAIQELDLIKDPTVKASQESLIITALELSRTKLTKPS